MSSPLGRGLESLIPKKDNGPEDPVVLDILHIQSGLKEPVYRFYDDTAAFSVGASAKDETTVLMASSPFSSEQPPPRTPVENSTGPKRPVPSPVESAQPRKSKESIFWIDVGKIEPNPYQPRREFDPKELAALADSIKDRGMLQPLLVTKIELDIPGGLDVRYQLIAGERRLRAAKIAGLREVPVIIRLAETPEGEKLELALIENVQREDLNPMERARAFGRLVDEFGLMQKEVAERIGKSREVVANALRLLKLPQDIQTAIFSGVITESHARTLLMLEHDLQAQRRLFDEITTANLSVRQAEIAARDSGGLVTAMRRRSRISRLDPDSRELQGRLEEFFGTRVKVLKKGEQGKIVVEFYSDEELKGILDRIGRRKEGYV